MKTIKRLTRQRQGRVTLAEARTLFALAAQGRPIHEGDNRHALNRAWNWFRCGIDLAQNGRLTANDMASLRRDLPPLLALDRLEELIERGAHGGVVVDFAGLEAFAGQCINHFEYAITRVLVHFAAQYGLGCRHVRGLKQRRLPRNVRALAAVIEKHTNRQPALPVVGDVLPGRFRDLSEKLMHLGRMLEVEWELGDLHKPKTAKKFPRRQAR